MKKVLISIALVLVLISISLLFSEFSARIGHTCGASEITFKNVYWLYEWISAEKPQGFIDCVGASTILVYRAVDVSAALILVSSILFVYAVFKK